MLEGSARSLNRKWIQDNSRATGLFVYDIAIDLRRLFSISLDLFEPEVNPQMLEELKEEGWIRKETKNGFWKFYYPNGELNTEGFYVDGYLDGCWKKYNEEGKLITMAYFDMGEKSNYWYYLHDSAGGIHYAKTLEEHNVNKTNYIN